MSTIYTVGDGKRTQITFDNGVWYVRTKNKRGLWGAWEPQGGKPYEFGMYPAPRAGQAKIRLTV